jgi:hypothetical protein
MVSGTVLILTIPMGGARGTSGKDILLQLNPSRAVLVHRYVAGLTGFSGLPSKPQRSKSLAILCYPVVIWIIPTIRLQNGTRLSVIPELLEYNDKAPSGNQVPTPFIRFKSDWFSPPGRWRILGVCPP